MNGMGEAPGKVWFFELAEAVIDADRCVRCGACIAACPSDSLGINSDDDLPYLVKMCTGCSLCWDFCPRGGLRYEATWPTEPDEDEPSRRSPVSRRGRASGSSVAASRRVSIRTARTSPSGAQDGGVVTALLIAALERGTIDEARSSLSRGPRDAVARRPIRRDDA